MELVPATVRIELAVTDNERERLEPRISAEIDILRHELALPLQIALEVVTSQPGNGGYGDKRVGVSVDGIKLAAYPSRHLPNDRTEGAVLEALHAHREAFVTPRLVAALWASWTESNAEPPAEFELLLRKLVRNHICIDRVASDVKAWNENSLQTAFEQALSQTNRSIRIQLHPETATAYEERRKAITAEREEDDPISMMVDGLFYELGLHIGDCRFVSVADMPKLETRVIVNDLRGRPIQLMPEQEVLVNDTVDRLRLLNIKGCETLNPANGSESAFIPAEFGDLAEKVGLTTWDGLGYLILTVAAEVRANAHSMLSLEAIEFALIKLERAFPELVALAQTRIGVQNLAEILRLLLEEEISIRDMRAILEVLLALPSDPCGGLDDYIVFSSGLRPGVISDDSMNREEVLESVEAVRCALKRYISHKYTRGGNVLVVYLLDPQIEDLLRRSTALTLEERASILSAMRRELGLLPTSAQDPVILVPVSIRSRLQRMVKLEFPELSVLAYQELAPEMNIQPIARIELE